MRQAYVEVRVHAAGGPTWTGAPRAKKAKQGNVGSGRVFICGVTATDAAVEAIDSMLPGVAALVLPPSAFGSLRERTGELDTAIDDLRGVAARVQASLIAESPGLGVQVGACGRCEANIASMRLADERRASRLASVVKTTHSSDLQPKTQIGQARGEDRRGARGTVARSGLAAIGGTASDKPADPRQARADARWSNPAPVADPSAAKPAQASKAKGKVK